MSEEIKKTEEVKRPASVGVAKNTKLFGTVTEAEANKYIDSLNEEDAIKILKVTKINEVSKEDIVRIMQDKEKALDSYEFCKEQLSGFKYVFVIMFKE